MVDYGKISGWLEFCEKHHTAGCCEAEKVTLSGFRLIDCHNLCIVPAPNHCEYVALSYVWGNRLDEANTDVLGSHTPLVIQDATRVAYRLGVRYVWVDRYCIDQNSEEKDHQIRNMNLIYRGAKLTIIAAAGEDPSFKLPRVSSKERTPQPILQVKGHLLISSLPDPSAELSSSKWASRGWTYQEGFLSRRRLVFARSQVLFQCMNMHCWEAISIPLHIMHTKRPQEIP
ncbi:HET-domain-containing protein [Hyaloscypha hepaticicola]|uniref:HET-domain-containing protein n=1 Tax=Hyaloscypha hepaticicola TaxID=2082293 RepID=A0A2J6PR96_9HELO|nr:HET-domain-containing protein [Hyaloscypha hepaticicola]